MLAENSAESLTMLFSKLMPWTLTAGRWCSCVNDEFCVTTVSV